jgi:hypothetical protein
MLTKRVCGAKMLAFFLDVESDRTPTQNKLPHFSKRELPNATKLICQSRIELK